jgi:small subunit ribosomal protein S1
MNDKEEITPNWFEQAIDDYDYERPKRGQFVEGNILRIDDDAILVDIGVKRDAIVPSWDLNMLPKDFLAGLSTGSDVLVCIMRPPEGDQDLLVSLNKGLEYKSWEHAETYLENGLTFEVEIIGENRGGLLANFEGLRAFIPNSQVAELRRRDSQRARQLKNELIGQKLLVKVIEVDRDRQRLILSALAAEDEQRKKRLEELEERQIILGTVSSTVKFGVFVDLGRIDGLVHISELDWQRVDRPSDLFKVGDEIQVQVIGIDVERERVSLSRKALLPSPWQQIEQQFKPGDVIEGEVKNVLDFGAFVEVADGIEGLVHVSEIGYSATGAPQDLVKPGEKILIRILNIDSDRERISLSMRRVPIEEQIAWMTENEIRAVAEEAEQPGAEVAETTGEVAETVEAEAAVETGTNAEMETAAEADSSVETDTTAEAAETTGEVAETAEAEAVVETDTTAEVEATAEVDSSTEPDTTAEAGEIPEAENSAEADTASADTAAEASAPELQPAAELETETAAETASEVEPASEEPPADSADEQK